MRVATLPAAVSISEIGDAKELTKAALVTLHCTLQIALPAPEKVLDAQRRQALQQGSDCRRQRHKHRHAGLRPAQEKNATFIQAIAFEADCIFDGKTAPAHQ